MKELVNMIDDFFIKKNNMTLKDYHRIKTNHKWFEEQFANMEKSWFKKR